VRRIVVASSSSVYGANGKLPKHEDDPLRPISPYATAKLASENYALSFHHVYGLDTVVLRYFNVFGPRQDPGSEYAAVIPRFISRLSSGEAPVIYGDGEQSRDFTYVDNVVDANLLAFEASNVAGQVYNIACGHRVTINRLLSDLTDIIGSDVAPAFAAPRPGEVQHSLADISRAREQLGYEPNVDVSAGLRRTVESLLERSAEPLGS
jgi:nucleoside-diphosphate-sugar epimerase